MARMTTQSDYTDMLPLKSEMLSLCQDWLMEIESLVRHTAKWANRLLTKGQIAQDSDALPVLNILLKLTDKTLMKLSLYMELIESDVSIADLYADFLEIQALIFGIEAAAEIFRKGHFGQLDHASEQYVSKITRYAEILIMLVKEAEPLAEVKKDRGFQ
jgi:hypothetical protein